MPSDVFGKVFSSDVDESIAAAETYSPRRCSPASTRRRAAGQAVSFGGQPGAGGATMMSKEQREVVRDWAKNNGYSIGDRGRIKAEILAAFKPRTTDRRLTPAWRQARHARG